MSSVALAWAATVIADARRANAPIGAPFCDEAERALLVLAEHAGADGLCRVPLERLVLRSRLGAGTLRRMVRLLWAEGLVSRAALDGSRDAVVAWGWPLQVALHLPDILALPCGAGSAVAR